MQQLSTINRLPLISNPSRKALFNFTQLSNLPLTKLLQCIISQIQVERQILVLVFNILHLVEDLFHLGHGHLFFLIFLLGLFFVGLWDLCLCVCYVEVFGFVPEWVLIAYFCDFYWFFSCLVDWVVFVWVFFNINQIIGQGLKIIIMQDRRYNIKTSIQNQIGHLWSILIKIFLCTQYLINAFCQVFSHPLWDLKLIHGCLSLVVNNVNLIVLTHWWKNWRKS